LVDILLGEMPRFRTEAERLPDTPEARRRLLRGLMNVRPPMPLRKDFLNEQDKLLREETEVRGVVSIGNLPTVAEIRGDAADDFFSRVVLWQGDVTRLAADAIVNAANSALLGCFVPGHLCIDNVIHSAAGLQLRDACAAIMRGQGHDEPTGSAKLTPGFNLPARCVLHTVGPIVAPDESGKFTPTEKDAALLASCYRSCLSLAEKHGLKSVAFCCISTGEFGFPQRHAAQIAVQTVRAYKAAAHSDIEVVFNVFKDEDYEIYRGLLG
jgi:O-acetyl-ADP-ribose deacetylase (regulator of RNase III)